MSLDGDNEVKESGFPLIKCTKVMASAVFGFTKKGTHKQSYLCSSPDVPCPKVSAQSSEKWMSRRPWKGNRTDPQWREDGKEDLEEKSESNVRKKGVECQEKSYRR